MTYLVTIPIAGHITFEVEAESKQAAIEAAQSQDSDNGEVTWETLEKFHSGNVCHCPSPWQIDVEEME